MRHGLVIGKFLPPHAGHRHVISTAAARCERVTVLVMGATAEYPGMDERAAWLTAMVADLPEVTVRTVADDAPMDYASDPAWRAHVGVMVAALTAAGAPGVDAVFSSEVYGGELARRLGAASVLVDTERSRHPISAGMIRSDPVAHWAALPAPVRAGLAVRVVILGAESTGTTTLATDLAEALRARGGIWRRTRCVPEYGREYTELRYRELQRARPDAQVNEIDWTSADFPIVAAEQTRRENEAAAAGSPVLVCDTDALATTLWERRYAGTATSARFGHALLPRRDIYLLTDPEGVGFEQDGWRDGEHLRLDMHRWFVRTLAAGPHSWFPVSGTRSERLDLALGVTDELLRHRLTFRMPEGAVVSPPPAGGTDRP